MEMLQQFKIVFIPDTNTYELWCTDSKGKWDLGYTFNTFTKDGNIIDSEHNDDWGMVSEHIIWEINYMIFLGYEFIGIERAQTTSYNI